MFRQWSFRRKLNAAAAAQNRMPALSSGGKVELDVPVIQHLSGVLRDYSLCLRNQAYLSAGVDRGNIPGYRSVNAVSHSVATDAWKALMWGAETISERYVRGKCIDAIEQALWPDRLFQIECRRDKDDLHGQHGENISPVMTERIYDGYRNLLHKQGVISQKDVANFYYKTVLTRRRGKNSFQYGDSEFFDTDDSQIHRQTTRMLIPKLSQCDPQTAFDVLAWIVRPDMQRKLSIQYLREQGKGIDEHDSELDPWIPLELSIAEQRMVAESLAVVIRTRGLSIYDSCVTDDSGDVAVVVAPLVELVASQENRALIIRAIIDVLADECNQDAYRLFALCQSIRLLFSSSAESLTESDLDILATVPDVDRGRHHEDFEWRFADNQDIREIAVAELNHRRQADK